EGGHAANDDCHFQDSKEADQPCNPDAERRPLDPPMAGRSQQIDDEQQRQHKRSYKQELQRSPHNKNSKWSLIHMTGIIVQGPQSAITKSAAHCKESDDSFVQTEWRK